MNYWIWLATIEELGPIKKKRLIDTFGTPEGIYKASNRCLLEIEGITEKIVENINRSKQEELIKKYENYIEKNRISIISILDEKYPEKLRNIYAPPITLFCIRNTDLLNKISIAIVGTREPSSYGINLARHFSKELSLANITVVSGLARGIDGEAHVGALEASGKTIAVLGNGVDIVYPKENIKTYNLVAKKGLILSEYIVGTKPEARNFPQRNRIISGLSSGVLVVEAKKRSGSIITADLALEQGREVYVVPGNITSPNSEGTNSLLKQGAKLITEVTDILEDLT